jgi:hypothetical protein
VLSFVVAITSVGYTAWRSSQETYLYAMTMTGVSMSPDGSNCVVSGTPKDLVQFVDRPYRRKADLLSADDDWQSFFNLWRAGGDFDTDVKGKPPNAALRSNGNYTIVEIKNAFISNGVYYMTLIGAPGEEIGYCQDAIQIELFIDDAPAATCENYPNNKNCDKPGAGDIAGWCPVSPSYDANDCQCSGFTAPWSGWGKQGNCANGGSGWCGDCLTCLSNCA